MTQHLMRELGAIRERVSRLGKKVNDQLEDALEALLSGDSDKAEKVMDDDRLVDDEEVEIEEECLKIIALHQPVTRDLRFLITVLKVNNDLERVADHAVNLANISKKSVKKGMKDFPPHIVKMGRIVTDNCQNAIKAFVDEDSETAHAIFRDDQTINELCGLVYDEAKNIMSEDNGNFGHSIRVYRVGRELERVGDLLKNIAEDTIYLITGEMVRHNRFVMMDIE